MAQNEIVDVIMHGAGNRFLIHFGSTEPSKLIAQHRNLDGVLILSSSKSCDLSMNIWNKDGSYAKQCGNGLRCVALHAVRSRIIESNTVWIETPAGQNRCVVDLIRNEVQVELPIIELGSEACHVDSRCKDIPDFDYVSVGNPNAVLWIKEEPMEIRSSLGEQFCCHPAFKEGMNIHFARRDDESHATCASWERGVGSTLASGTGGAAVFVSSGAKSLRVSSQGGTLHFKYNDLGNILMTGPANYE